MNIEHLRRSLKVQWLDYYRENRVWLTRLGVWVNCEGNRRPSSSFILATLSVLEPQLTQMLPLVVDLSSNPDRIVMALGLNFNPDEELTAIEQASAEELKLLPSFGVALPRLVQPLEAHAMEAQSIEAQATEVKPSTQAPKAQPIEAQAPEAQRKERSIDRSSLSQPISKPTQPSQPEPHQAASNSPDPSANPSAKRQDTQSSQPLNSAKSSQSSPDKPSSDKPSFGKPSPDKFSPDKSGSGKSSLEKSNPDKPEISATSPSPAPKPVLLEKPKAPAPSYGEPVVKQRPPMDTAELAQGQQPDRGTTRKRKGDRPASPERT
ncbi:MAG TPA: DUF5331 domain-containing protein [Coleofasciculaceae cyanobacterium]|jgi:hypothetical protein